MEIFGSRKSFTLIELLVVLAIVAILSVVVILTLNPAELMKQARDSTRLSDLSTLNTALAAYNADVTGGFMGTSTVVYVSLPDTSPTCANLGLPSLPAGYTYSCAIAANLKKADGTGWIPVNFSQISFGAPISNLPVDPVNTTTTGNYYTYVPGGSWILTTLPESAKQKTALTANPAIQHYPGVMAAGSNMNLSPIYNPNGLVGYWTFDEGTGTVAADSSGEGNDGAFQGTGSNWTGGRVGNYAAQFNGGNYFESPSASSLNFGTSGFSVSFWAKKAATGGQHSFIGKNSATNVPGWIIYQHSDGRSLVLLVSDGTGAYDSIPYNDGINDGAWHHVVGVMDRSGSTLYLYVDGVLVKSGATSIAGSVSNAHVLDMGYTWGLLDGLLDDVRIYNRALSAAEILAIYNSTK